MPRPKVCKLWKGMVINMDNEKHSLHIGSLITGILFLLIIMTYFIGLLANSPNMIKDIKKSVNKALSVNIDQDTEEEDIINENIEQKSSSSTTSFSAKLGTVFSRTESAINDSIPGRLSLIDWNGLAQRILQKRMIPEANENNTVYKMDNGQLTYTYPDIGVRIAHKNFTVLNKYLKSVGTKLLYVQAPYKVNRDKNELPYGLEDYPNKNADKLLEGLNKLNIDYIDFREVFANNFLNYPSLFFNTDHHWTTETSFFAYQYMLDYLEKNYGFQYNKQTYNKANYNQVTLKQSFIGSLANRVGKWYAGIDDFTFIYPNFKTKLTYMKFDANASLYLVRNGTFEESVFYPERMENPDTPLAYRDNCYLGGNPDLGRIINHNVQKGKILFVQDSYGKPIASFMALNFHEVDIIDLRYFTESYLMDFIKRETTPYDYVVILYNTSALKRSTYYRQFRFYDYE